MFHFRSRMNHNRQMTVLVVTCLSSLFFSSQGLLSHQKSSLRRSYEQLPCPRLMPTIPSRPLAKYQSKRDQFVDRDMDKENERNAEMKEGSQGESRLYESDEMRIGENFDTDFEDSNRPPSTSPNELHLAPAIFATVLFVSFWPLLALLRSTASPIDGFDIDMFMALKGIMDPTPMDNMDPTSIVELPSLSPAEQLVGAIFGPPQ